MLADGWEVVGYTVNILAMGAQSFNILLRKGNSLTNYSILKNGGQDTRGKMPLTPHTPAVKKGFFS
jgi:hypothetical protein